MFPNLAVNNKYLTPDQKFLLAANNSVSGITVIGTAAAAGISQARDTKTSYGQGAEGYFNLSVGEPAWLSLPPATWSAHLPWHPYCMKIHATL